MADGKSVPSVGDLVAGNYQILGTAGAGGMGVVYRALDVKLQRTVALKFLPPDLDASERDKERFLREARTASSLDHPNIGVIYAIEDTPEGHAFIAMAFYEGQTLSQRIRSGPISPTAVADIAIQMLKGLEHAHLQGVEHRDVKPSNIVLTHQPGTSGPTVKIVDFGLAHVSQQTASKTHGISGTVAYMSPEQTLGRTVDSRADIWSAGIVLLEMLVGHNPFLRDTIPGTIFAILNEPPELPDSVPPGLRQVVYRALSKDPARRYQSCTEMLHDLEAVRASLPASVGVEPASAASGPKWLKESVELRRSRVSASASAWAITPAKSRWKPWVFGLGGAAILLMATLLIPAVRARLSGLLAPAASGTEGGSGKSTAEQGYLVALGYVQRYDKPGNLDLAITALQGSLTADPLFALGYAELGEAYRMKYQTGRDPKWLDLALASCERAQQLDTRLAGAYSTLAYIHNEKGMHDLALQEFHQALDINPRDAAALTGIARSDESAGKIQEAEDGYKRAIAVLPADWRGFNELGNFYSNQGKYPQAIAQYKQGLELTPDNALLYSNLGAAYLNSGDTRLFPDAEQSLKRSLGLHPTYEVLANLSALYSQRQDYAQSAAYSLQALKMNDRDYIVWDNLRLAYEALGEAAKANDALRHEMPVLEASVKVRSQDGLSQAILADLYARDGSPEKAGPRIQSALSLSPNDPQVLLEIADTYANLRDPASARDYIQKALRKGADIETVKTDVELKSLNLDFDKEFRKK